MNFLTSSWMERMLFTVVIIGTILTLYGVVRVIDTSIQINNNSAQQLHEKGETLEIQTSADGHGIMTADLERRGLLKMRGEMIMLAGIGLVVLGFGWLGYNFRNSRLRREDESVIAEAR